MSRDKVFEGLMRPICLSVCMSADIACKFWSVKCTQSLVCMFFWSSTFRSHQCWPLSDLDIKPMILIHHVSDGKKVYSHILLSFEILYFFHENISRCHNRWCNALYLKLILVSNAMMLCPLSEICVGIHSNGVMSFIRNS